MTEAASICRDQGGQELIWSVYEPNKNWRPSSTNTLVARFVRSLEFMAGR